MVRCECNWTNDGHGRQIVVGKICNACYEYYQEKLRRIEARKNQLKLFDDNEYKYDR